MNNINLKEKMILFEQMINTADENIANQLIDSKAAFYTPAKPEPLYGGNGYLSFVFFLRKGFSDIQWKAKEIVAENNIVAVYWELKGTHDGEFMGVKATGATLNTTVMNFYYFNEDGKIINDVAAEGMIGILRTLGLSK